MTAETKDLVIKRLKSLAWRVGIMALTAIIAFAIQNLGLFNIPAQIQVLIGLILGEVSKYLNSQSGTF